VRGPDVEIGPVLTPSADACLECLTTRAELNDAHRRLDYQTIRPGRTFETAFATHLLTQVTLQAGLGRIPPALVGAIHRFDCRAFQHDSARLLGVPGCEACDAGD
jgi:bacteriocin biosynthesis cyclodehydratase domain-containing protein